MNKQLPGAFGENDELAAIFERFRSAERYEEWEANKELVKHDAENFLALEPMLDKKELFDDAKGANLTIEQLEEDPDIANSPHFSHIKKQFQNKEGKREAGEVVWIKEGITGVGGVAYGGENINPFRINKVAVGYAVIERFLNMDDGNYSRSVIEEDEREQLLENIKDIKEEMSECKLTGKDIDEVKLRELFKMVRNVHDRFLK